MPAALSIHRAPSGIVPLRFLLGAPWFAAIAGVLLLWAGSDAFASRWSAAVLAATHLLTVGFMAHAMLGALLQLLPVAFGVPLPHASVVSSVSHPALALGAPCLAAAFLTGLPLMFGVAALLLAFAFGIYIAEVGWAILRQRLRDPLARVIAAALLALLVTVSLGLLLAGGMAGVSVPLLEITHLHAVWGIVGWTLLLVLGAALAVVPMFQMTASYPRWLRGPFAVATIVALIAWSLAFWFGLAPIRTLLQWLLAAAAITVGIATLVLQQRGRRRLQPDATFLFWRMGMSCLVAAVLVWAVGEALALQARPSLALLAGVLLLPGFAYCVISGMLYKIVPFLLWLALQMHRGARPPTVKEIMPECAGRRQYWVHLAAIVLLSVAATVWAPAIYAGALAFTVSSVMLGSRLARAAWFAHAHKVRIRALPTGSGRSGWTRLS